MPELSPKARAVLTAVTLRAYDIPPEGSPQFVQEITPLLTSALRATLDQIRDCDSLLHAMETIDSITHELHHYSQSA